MNSTIKTVHWSTCTMLRASNGADLATAAVRMARQRIPVFPCVPGGKQPLTPRGFHDASSDHDRVSRWWRRTPDANVGVPTGASSGMAVVDVDVHGAVNGFGAFERARSAGLTNGWGWLVRTPSGGLHAYFPPIPGVEQRSWQVPGKHVDFRGDGGYVIAPPSRILVEGEERTYEVIAVAQHMPRPLDASRLRRFLDPPRPGPPPRSMPTVGARPDKLAEWVATRPEGSRNNGLFWAACRMAEGGHGYDATLAALGDAARVAGLTDREAETTIRSAYRIASRLSPRSGHVPSQTTEGVRL